MAAFSRRLCRAARRARAAAVWWAAGWATAAAAPAAAQPAAVAADEAASGHAGPAELTAAAIVAQARARSGLGLGQATATVSLVIHGADGQVRRRQLTLRSRRVGQAAQLMVRLLAPADVAGTGFLVLQQDDGKAQQYLYLPALDKTKRVTGRQRDEPFLGSDLRLGDLQDEHWDDATLTRLPDTVVGGSACYVVEARARAGSDAPYALTRATIHRQAMVPVRVDFFAPAEQLVKTLRVTRLARRAGGWVAMGSTVADVVRGSRTEIVIDHIDEQTPLGDADFTLRALAAP